MSSPILMHLPAMTDQQRNSFYISYNAEQKSEVAGVLLAVFLGGIGIHHFYLGRTGLGVLYLVFGVTGIPWLIALVEAFFMPGRVRRYNAELSNYLAAVITGQAVAAGVGTLPAPTVYCPACGASTHGGLHFCGRCGAAIAS